MEKNNVLFRYLSMAFPHGVKISKFIENPEIVTYISEPHLIKALHFDYVTIEDEPFEDGLPDIVAWSLDEIKPYLRPMESMTEKEREWYYLFDTWNKAQQVCFVQMRAMVRSAFESVNGYIRWFDK